MRLKQNLTLILLQEHWYKTKLTFDLRFWLEILMSCKTWKKNLSCLLHSVTPTISNAAHIFNLNLKPLGSRHLRTFENWDSVTSCSGTFSLLLSPWFLMWEDRTEPPNRNKELSKLLCSQKYKSPKANRENEWEPAVGQDVTYCSWGCFFNSLGEMNGCSPVSGRQVYYTTANFSKLSSW